LTAENNSSVSATDQVSAVFTLLAAM